MKRLLPLLLFIAMAWCACTNSVVAPAVTTGTITATVNGVDETFNVSDSVKYISKQPQTADWWFQASGHNSAAATTDEIHFLVDYQAPIVAGVTYSNDITDYPINVHMSFQTGNKIYLASYGSPLPVKVTVTSFSTTNVQGTFSGSPANGGDTETIANGKFNLYFAAPVTP